MMMNRQFIASVAILFLATLALFGFLIIPSMLKVKEIRTGIATEHAKIQDRYDRRGQLKEALQSLQEIRSGIGGLTAIAVRQGEELDFVQAMEDASSDTGITQDLALKTADQRALSDWERIVPVTISAEGRFGDVLRYLKEVERLPYVLDVDSFVIRSLRAQGTTGASAVRADLVGSVYWLTEDIPPFIQNEQL